MFRHFLFHALVNVILMLILCLSHLSNAKRQCCPNVTELMLSQLTYTTEFLLLFNIDDQRYNNTGQLFSAHWDTENDCPPNCFKSR